MHKRAWPSWVGLSASFVAAADIALLLWVGVGPMRLAICALFLVAAGLTGALCLRGREELFPDRFTLALAAVTLGLVLHMMLCFVLFHDEVAHALGIPDRRTAAVVALSILCGCGVVHLLASRRRTSTLPRFACPGSASIVFALASIVAVASHFGFGNDLRRVNHLERPRVVNTVVADYFAHYAEPGEPRTRLSPPEWGSRIDSLWYVWLMPRVLEEYGLPGSFEPSQPGESTRLGQFQHIGVTLQLLGLTDATGSFGARSSAACSKVLALAWAVLFGWWIFSIGHDVLGLSERSALLGVAGGFLFSTLDLTPFIGDHIVPAHVLTYIATPIYWNMNQLAQLAVGAGGFFLVLRALAVGSASYALGCVLIASSLLYKPSLYFAAVPAIGLASLRLKRPLLPADVVVGWLALLAAAAFWFGYPRVMGLTSLASPIDLSFLELQAFYAKNQVLVGTWIADLGPAGVKATIVVLVLAAWIVPLAHQARTCLAGGAERRRTLLAVLMRPEIRALWLLFAWGMFSAWCFVEDFEDQSRRNSNNYYFGGAVAYTACMPLLVLAIGKVQPRPLRIVGWIVYAAHLASGVLSLWIYARQGRLT